MRMHILGRVSDTFDIQIFEHLPLFVQVEVFKGEFLYVADEDELYDLALKISREYEFFKPHYLDYIGERELLSWNPFISSYIPRIDDKMKSNICEYWFD